MSYKEIAELMRETEQKLIKEFIVDLNKAYNQKSMGLCRTFVGYAIDKWEGK